MLVRYIPVINIILITDSNRSIATLAITTLLKTGAESSVDRLMKQIASFVSEISDEFKIVVVQAISALCTKFPKKHGILLNFLSGMLRFLSFQLFLLPILRPTVFRAPPPFLH